MNILGTGVIFVGGVGIGALEETLRRGWSEPAEIEAIRAAGGKRKVFQVNMDAVPDRTLLKKIRRADKLSKMAVIAAADALADSGIDAAGKRVGLILATAFGAHVTTFDFLNDILDYGDTSVSPTTFSNSVHNAAASYVSLCLNIRGPTMTVTQFRFSFPAALQLAMAWLEQGRCDYALVGAADQYGDVLGYVSEQKLNTAEDGRINPFVFQQPRQTPGEGAMFFLLGRERSAGAYCALTGVAIGGEPGRDEPADLTIIDADGMLPDESAYGAALAPGTLVTGYTPLFGSMMTGGAFNLAAGALMLKQQIRYAAPVTDNPHGLALVDATGPAEIKTVRGLGCNCYGEFSSVTLARLP